MFEERKTKIISGIVERIVNDKVINRFVKRLEDLRLKEKIDEVYLFGSRAKGTERPNSDYDLLLIVNFKETSDIIKFKDKAYDIVMEILLDTGCVVSLKIFKKSEFERLCSLGTPFTKNILKESIKIG